MPKQRIARDLITESPTTELQADAEIPIEHLVATFVPILRDRPDLAGVTVTEGAEVIGRIPRDSLVGRKIDKNAILPEANYYVCPLGDFRKLVWIAPVPPDCLYCPKHAIVLEPA